MNPANQRKAAELSLIAAMDKMIDVPSHSRLYREVKKASQLAKNALPVAAAKLTNQEIGIVSHLIGTWESRAFGKNAPQPIGVIVGFAALILEKSPVVEGGPYWPVLANITDALERSHQEFSYGKAVNAANIWQTLMHALESGDLARIALPEPLR